MISYHKGDVLESGADIIAHQVNLQGSMGGGLALQIAKKYPKCEENYIRHIKEFQKGGEVQLFPIDYQTNKQFIANCFSQQRNFNTNYDWLKRCFSALRKFALRNFDWMYPTIAIPKNYGCGIANGDWNTVEQIFKDIFENEQDIDFQIWEFEFNGGKTK